MPYYTQRDPRWKNIVMGKGEGTIGDVGCYLVSLCNWLNKLGYSFTPATLNEYFKDKKLWSGPYKNYIDVALIAQKASEIFTEFIREEPWSDMARLNWYLNNGYAVLGKVDARGIGGSGSHFVAIFDTEGKNAIIHDPWTGEYQPVACLSGRVF